MVVVGASSLISLVGCWRGGVVGVPGKKDFEAEVTFKSLDWSDLFVLGGVEFRSWDEL